MEVSSVFLNFSSKMQMLQVLVLQRFNLIRLPTIRIKSDTGTKQNREQKIEHLLVTTASTAKP
jgi:hypothetical protein